MKTIQTREIILTISLLVMFSACSTKTDSLVSNETFLNKRKDIATKKQVKKKVYFSVKNQTIATLLDKLSKEYDIVYMLEDSDISLKNSEYKVSTVNELKKYVNKTTDYNLVSTNPTYKKNGIYKLRLELKNGKHINGRKRFSMFKNRGIALDRPMTVQQFFKRLNKLDKNKYYTVKGNANIPMERGVVIKSVDELKKYLANRQRIQMQIRSNGKFVSIFVK